MSKTKVYISIFLIAAILLVIFFGIFTTKISELKSFIKDYINKDYYYSKESSGKDEFKIIDPSKFKRYKKTYKNVPDNFLHLGNILLYIGKKGEFLRDIARKSIKYTHFYRCYKLQQAISNYNGIKDFKLRKDMFLYIPHSLSSLIPITKKNRKPVIVYSRGLYFTGSNLGSRNIYKLIEKFKKTGINTIVFDVKDVTGIVSYFSYVPDAQEYNTHQKRTIDDIDKLIRILKKANIYTIARIAVFRDHLLCKKNPDFAIKSKRTGQTWNKNSNELWCDPTNKQVQDYNIGLAIELCEKGVDEIQFDYIRFPTTGDLADAQYKYSFGKLLKEDTIAHFLKRAHKEISARNTRLSIDIFGVVAWGKEVDIRKTGQRVGSLARYCDVISPMLYPSHFNDDFDGFANPGDEPFYFIYKGSKKTDALANGRIIRPWLQAFKWRVSKYDERYIYKQIVGCREGGAFGYLFWNSKNNYDVVYKALEKLIAIKNEDRE